MKKNCRAMEFLMIVVLIGMVVVVLAGGLDIKQAIEDVEPTPEIVEDIFEEDVTAPTPVVTNVVAEEPEEDEQNTYPLLYTDKDAVVLAQMLWGEARGVRDLELSDGRVISGDAQRAACIWTVLNRLDNGGYADSIVEIITAPKQFVGYSANHPVDEELLGLAYDVLDRWNREKHGETDVGRVLPADYYWFASGGDGHNYFRNEYRTDKRWQWTLGDPYAWTME